MAIARVYHLVCDCCGSPAEIGDSRAEACHLGRAAGWRVGPGQSRAAICPRCIPTGHDRTHCLSRRQTVCFTGDSTEGEEPR